MNRFVLMIGLIGVLLIVGSAAAETVENGDHTRIKLYFHSEGDDIEFNMSTMGPGSGDGGNINTGDTTIRDYTLNQSLKHNLTVFGEDLGGGEKGFRANISISCSDIDPGDNTDAQLSIVDNTNDTIVAESQRYTAQTTWLIPFVNGSWENYTFSEGHEIIVRITVRTTATLGGTATVNTDGDYWLRVDCSPVELRFDIDTYDHTVHDMNQKRVYPGEECKEFQPNIPLPLRYMNITGEVENAFGTYDVRRVTLTIYEDNGEGDTVLSDSLTIHENDYTNEFVYKFYMIWEWNVKNITATDPSNHADVYRIYPTFINADDIEFTSIHNSTRFDMLEYAVFMSFDDLGQTYETFGEINSSVDVEFTVYNTGLSQETITVKVGSIENWTVSLDNDNFILSYDNSINITATVEIPGTAGKFDDDNFQVKASADEYLGFKHAINFIVEATPTIKFDFINLNNLTQTVVPGETAVFDFKVTNEGSEPMDFDLRNDAPGQGWTVTYNPSSSIENLDDGVSATVNVRIKAPSNIQASTPREQDLFIYAFPRGHSDLERKIMTHTILEAYDIIQGISPATGESTVKETHPDWEYDPVVFHVDILNGETDTVDVSFEIDYVKSTTFDESEWTIEIPNDDTLDADETETYDFSFTPDDDIIPIPVSYEVWFIVLFDDGETKSETDLLKIDVEALAGAAAATVGDTDAKIEHDDKVTFSFEITNEGNLDDTFEVRVSGIDSAWEVSIDGETGDTNTIDIDKGEKVTINIELEPPEKAAGHTFDITIDIESNNDNDEREQLSFTIKVKEKDDAPTSREILDRMLPLIALVVVLIIMFALFRRKSRRHD